MRKQMNLKTIVSGIVAIIISVLLVNVLNDYIFSFKENIIDGKVKVFAPGKLKSQTQVFEVEGNPVLLKRYLWEKNKISYMVISIEYPQSYYKNKGIEQVISESKNNLIANANIQMISDKKIMINEHEGSEFDFNS
jgi:hypothetical protein